MRPKTPNMGTLPATEGQEGEAYDGGVYIAESFIIAAGAKWPWAPKEAYRFARARLQRKRARILERGPDQVAIDAVLGVRGPALVKFLDAACEYLTALERADAIDDAAATKEEG